MFPGASSDIGSDKFEPAYYLLDKHRFSNFEVRPFRFNFSFRPQAKGQIISECHFDFL